MDRAAREGGRVVNTERPMRDMARCYAESAAHVLTATIDMGGQSVEAIISGTIEGDSMRGSMVMGEMGSFDFTGTRPR